MEIPQLVGLILKKATEVTPAPHLACKLLTLLKNWKLSNEIVDAVLNHHRLPQPNKVDYSMLVYVANRCAHAESPFVFETFQQQIGLPVAAQLNLKPDNMANLFSCIHSLAERLEKGMAVS